MSGDSSIDPATLDRLLSQAESLRSLAVRVGFGPDAADDAVQETLLAAVQREPAEASHGWLRVALKRRLLMGRRAESRRHAREQVAAREEADPNDPAHAAEQAELARTLRDAVDALPRRDREVLALRFFANLAPAEIAATLGETPAAVSSRLTRAVKRLRRDMTSDRSRASGRVSPALGVLPALRSFRSTLVRSAHAALPVMTPSLMKKTLSMVLVVLFLGVGALVLDRPLPERSDERIAVAEPGPELAPIDEPAAPDDPRVRVREEAAPAVKEPTSPASPAESPSTGSLEVRVVEESSGRPAQGILVTLSTATFGEPWDLPTGELTDADGVCGFDGLPPGRIGVQVARAGADGNHPYAYPTIEADRATEVEFEVDPLHPVSGRVEDEYGRPVAGAEIWIGAEMGPALHGSVAGITDDDGRFEVEYVSRGQLVAATAEGHAPSPCFLAEVLIDHGDVFVLVVTRQAGSVTGIVTNEMGEPLEDVRIALGDTPRPRADVLPNGQRPWSPLPRHVRTGADGRFVFDFVEEGPVNVRARAVDHALTVQPIEVARGLTTDVALVLRRGGAIVGRVLDAGGEPSSGARIRIEQPFAEPLAQLRARADADGTFRLENVPPGTVHVDISDRGIEGKVKASVEVVAGADTRLDVQIPAPVKLTGVLTSASNEPLEGWFVISTALDQDEGRLMSLGVLTDSGGAFDFHPEAGERFLLEAYPPGRWSGDPLATLPSVERTGEPVAMTVPDAAIPGGVLEGRVVDDLGRPVAARVEITFESVPETRLEAECEADGTFRARYAPEASFRIEVNGPGTASMEVASTSKLGADEVRQVGVIVLR